MPKITPEITVRQQQSIRDRLQKKAATIVNRLSDFASGELVDKAGDKLELTSNELKAMDMVLARTVPTLTASTIEDVTPDRTIDDIESELEQLRIDTNEVKGIRLVK